MTTGKKCVVCGKWYPQSEFEYGERINNSSCGKCKVEYALIRVEEKSTGAQSWPLKMHLERESGGK